MTIAGSRARAICARRSKRCDAGGRWGRNDSLAVEHGNHSKFGPDMLASPLFREIIVRFAQKFLGVHPWSEGVDWDPIA